MRIGRELLRRPLAVLAPDEFVECATSSTSIAAMLGTGMCAAEAAGLLANRSALIAELSSVLADAPVGRSAFPRSSRYGVY